MERGDLAAVAIGLFLVVLLMAVLALAEVPSPVSSRATPIPTPPPATPVTPSPALTLAPVVELPETPAITSSRIFYTGNYFLLPVRYLPSDMGMFGFSDVEWQYNGSTVFAYVEENHGGITESFTVPYPVWRITSTLESTRTPHKARLRMILVDEATGQVLEGAEVNQPGSVTRVVVAESRPLYMVIGADNIERFMITLEAPSDVVG
jgi:hypothetical protein